MRKILKEHSFLCAIILFFLFALVLSALEPDNRGELSSFFDSDRKYKECVESCPKYGCLKYEKNSLGFNTCVEPAYEKCKLICIEKYK